MIRLRSLETADIAELAGFDAASNPFPWSERDLQTALAAAAVDCRVMMRGEVTIGYLVVQRVEDEAELQRIVVFKHWQSQGYGRQVMAMLVRELAKTGVRRLFLEVRESNRAARGLYCRVGFSETGQRKDYYPAPPGRENAILMQLDLPGAWAESKPLGRRSGK